MIRLLLGGVTIVSIACGGSNPTARTTAWQTPAKGAKSVTTQDTAKPRQSFVAVDHLYTAKEAIADIMASPLEFIGTGQWYGEAPFPPCAYKNDRVLVIDGYCTTNREITTFSILVFSKTKGYLKMYAYTQETKKPISKIRRQLYTDFYVTSQPPPAKGAIKQPLSFHMGYRELARYNGKRAGVYDLPSCWEGIRHDPKSGCNREMPSHYRPAFAKEHTLFVNNPPPLWYRFVKHMIAQRRHSWPKPKVFKATSAYWRGRAVDFRRQHGLSFHRFDGFEFRFGQKEFAPVIPMSDGSFILVANKTRRNGKDSPYVIRVADSGRIVWQRNLYRKGFAGFEAARGTSLPDGGLIVLVLAYTNEARSPIMRLVRLNSRGRIKWDWIGPGRGGDRTPYATKLHLTGRNTVLLKGHVYIDQQKRDWQSEVELGNGKNIK